VHDLGHYLENPTCHSIVFKRLFGWNKLNVEEIRKAKDKYRDENPSVNFRELQESLGNLKSLNLDSIEKYFSALKQFSDILKAN